MLRGSGAALPSVAVADKASLARAEIGIEEPRLRGRTAPLGSAPCDGVSGVQRRVLPLVEVRADFELSRSELRDADRGAEDADLEALDRAAHQIAVAENKAVFHGWHGAMTGIEEATPHAPIPLGEVPDNYRRPVAEAVERLLHNGISGPYGLALGG